jgi:hypothetical protein
VTTAVFQMELTLVGDVARISRREEKGVGNKSLLEQEGMAAASATEVPAHRMWLGRKGMGVDKGGLWGCNCRGPMGPRICEE